MKSMTWKNEMIDDALLTVWSRTNIHQKMCVCVCLYVHTIVDT